MIDEISYHEDLIVCSTAEERSAAGLDDGADIEKEMLVSQAGAHVSAQPPVDATEFEIGNSNYYIVDGKTDQYHPVTGVCDD
jgi:hypothetical protein